MESDKESRQPLNSDGEPRSTGPRKFRFRGTYALALWAPGLYLLMWASFAAAWVSLGRQPYPSQDDPKWIEGFWMWIYDVSWLWCLFGVPVALLLAVVSLVRTSPPADWFGRLRLPEWWMGILATILLGWVLIISYGKRLEPALWDWISTLFLLSFWAFVGIAFVYVSAAGLYRLLQRAREMPSMPPWPLFHFSLGFLLTIALLWAVWGRYPVVIFLSLAVSILIVAHRSVLRLIGWQMTPPTERSRRLFEVSVGYLVLIGTVPLVGTLENYLPHLVFEWWWD